MLVRNIGVGKYFPTCIGNIWLARGDTRNIRSAKAVEELRREKNLIFYREVELPPLRKPRLPREMEMKADYNGLAINTLRCLAREKGIKGVFQMRKPEIIKNLEAVMAKEVSDGL
jgi:hypothetical protein